MNQRMLAARASVVALWAGWVAWKRGNRERYNAYMRELRARKRAGFSGGT